MKDRRWHYKPEAGYARLGGPSTFEDEVIREEVNGGAHRAFCAARLKGGTAQGGIEAEINLVLDVMLPAACDPIPYALETDWPVGVAGFEPLHIRIGICQDSQPGGQDSNLRISN